MYKHEAISNQIFDSEKDKEFRLAREREAQIVQKHASSAPGPLMADLADNWLYAIRHLYKFFIKVDVELRLREKKQLGQADADDVCLRLGKFIESESQNLRMTLASKFRARGITEEEINRFLPSLDAQAQGIMSSVRKEVLERCNLHSP